ncbi:MAG: pirin family protein [Bacteroidota bacterium]
MSAAGLIIEERSRDIGDFLVGRLIPFRKKRMIGPFIFIDHMGPAVLGPEKYMDVDQHPHIGLATLTYLLDGELIHEDSIGTHQLLSPGAVNWMSAGSGASHTERTPMHLRNGITSTLHGFQIWVALPQHLEDSTPVFHHVSKEQLPSWKEGEATFTLLAGSGYGKTAPLPVPTALFMIEIKNEKGFTLTVKGQLKGEIGVCIVSGSLQACETTIEKGHILVSKVSDTCMLDVAPNSHLLLFGGPPYAEERHIYWNFVSSSKEKIEAAKEAWKQQTFPMMPKDNSYVPLP